MTISAPASTHGSTDVPEGFPAGTVEPAYELTRALDPDPACVFEGLSAEDRVRARLVLHQALALHRAGGGTGVVALCGGGGQGEALILKAAQ